MKLVQAITAMLPFLLFVPLQAEPVRASGCTPIPAEAWQITVYLVSNTGTSIKTAANLAGAVPHSEWCFSGKHINTPCPANYSNSDGVEFKHAYFGNGCLQFYAAS